MVETSSLLQNRLRKMTVSRFREEEHKSHPVFFLWFKITNLCAAAKILCVLGDFLMVFGDFLWFWVTFFDFRQNPKNLFLSTKIVRRKKYFFETLFIFLFL